MEKLARICGLALAALIAWAGVSSANAEPRAKLAILPFEINDTSGEVGPASRHAEMLSELTRYTGERIKAAGLYDVVDPGAVAKAVAEVNPGTYLRACNGCELDIARKAGADRVMIGWVWKVSTLIGTLHIEIKDVASGRTTYSKVFDFRGDNRKAWERATAYMVDSMRKARDADRAPDAG
ncbi:MAG TPA: DUF3280 domain-containing protein [Hyphomicrobium sp.]|nr:DUF3280 domain-containing protein [Hyphomicrobium sp.]